MTMSGNQRNNKKKFLGVWGFPNLRQTWAQNFTSLDTCCVTLGRSVTYVKSNCF